MNRNGTQDPAGSFILRPADGKRIPPGFPNHMHDFGKWRQGSFGRITGKQGPYFNNVALPGLFPDATAARVCDIIQMGGKLHPFHGIVLS